jgi:RimJ/RimL family protein N-acetyltransferase
LSLVEQWARQRAMLTGGTAMATEYNHLGQPVGFPLPNWTSPPPSPPHRAMQGRYCRLEPLQPDDHAKDLFAVFALDVEGKDWTYLTYGPFVSEAEFRTMLEADCASDDWLTFTIIDQASGKPYGVASYLRVAPAAGSIEVGGIHYSQPLKKTCAATEAMYLLMKNVFDLGYRRYEWKCDALNAPSRAAAQRLGFSFEGVFRQALVYKGRNRDTAWYSVIDAEWPALRPIIEKWLDPANFDAQGRQQLLLSDMTAPILKSIG